MSAKKQQHIERTLYYRDYKTKSALSFLSKDPTTKFELFWTPREEEWDEHYLCTYEVPEKYTLTPTLERQMGDDGRVRALLRIRYSTTLPTISSPSFELELLILPVEREDGSLHLAVVSAGSQCDERHKDLSFVKKELDRLSAAIENN